MNFPKLRLPLAGMAMAATLLASVPAQQAAALEEGDRAEIEAIIRAYLLENPEVMIEVQQALQKKQAEEQAEAQAKALVEMKDAIYSSKHQIEIGDKDAPITIVEFYDYNCGYCQRAMEDMNRLVDGEANVRFILKEFPVLGPPSVDAHKVSLAFSQLMPEKAAEFHRALLGREGRKDGDIAMQLAVALGADEAAMKEEIDKPYITEAIKEVYEMADALGISGTPSYVVGDEVVFGAVGFDQLSRKVAAVQECGKATC